MPMAGRGSRFSRDGIALPKPLIDLEGRPFFWWATESVRRAAPVEALVYVVLEDHVREHEIDRRIREYYPEAEVIALPDVTAGAAETAYLGLAGVKGAGPIAVNDCDHVFLCTGLPAATAELSAGADGGLMCFRSDSPAYSYIALNERGELTGTVEKQVVSTFAIAGCYLFANPSMFDELYCRYRDLCLYDELFISGLYNLLADDGGRLIKVEADQHCSFGTPEELSRVTPAIFAPFRAWKESP